MTKTKLQIMREKKGLTIEQLAEKISEIVNGAKDSISIEFTLRRYELKTSKLKASEYNNNLEITAQALGCSVDELVEEE